MFQGFDRDGSGSIDGSEFGQALRQLGYNFSPTFVQVGGVGAGLEMFNINPIFYKYPRIF